MAHLPAPRCRPSRELDGDRFKKAPELVGAIALRVGKEHPVPIVEGDADVLLFITPPNTVGTRLCVPKRNLL